MIQAGTIRIGSRQTVSVAGEYWISSMSRLRATTFPGVTATLAANPKRLRSDGLLAFGNAPLVFPKIHGSTDKVLSTFLNGGLEHVRVGEQEIRRRNHIERLARDKRDDIFMMVGDALHAGRRMVPPLLREQEAL